ncbi:VWA domain-containing protein [Ramlibacter sp.]|uniref:vWA domain-containing protein n=1 Tax=Ramlibacter sp. TaxID=1917967 RepID=UPI0035B3F5F9
MQIIRPWLAVVLAAALTLAACGKPADPPSSARTSPPPAPVAQAFRVLATSDLRDAQPLEEMVLKATGVPLQFTFGGTMESTEAVLTGTTRADAAWFANAKYLLADAQGQSRVKLQEKIMLSPIVVGVSRSQAQALGWDQPAMAGKITWKTVAQAAQEGQLRYALSNPATSNQGFMALMGVAAAAAGKPEALAAADVDRSAISAFIRGYKLPGDNSTYLSEKFIEQQGPRLNAFINYESWLLSLNQSGKLKEPLTLVYPHEGVATADYPFMLLNEARRADYQKVVDYLKGEAAQTWLARTTLRRPVNSAVAQAQASLFPSGGLLVELPFSPDRALADGLIDAYLNEFRTPIASTFVLDTSGSMNASGRRTQLVQALQYIAGDDASLTGRIARLTSREKVWMLPFSDAPGEPRLFELPASRPSARGVQVQQDSAAKKATLAEVRDYAERLNMTGSTALYDAVLKALQLMLDERARHGRYQYSVVAFTDGENNRGRNLAEFKAAYAALPEDVRAIPVFMVVFGEANERELRELVATTGGRVFDARKASLYSVFKDIRAYQ